MFASWTGRRTSTCLTCLFAEPRQRRVREGCAGVLSLLPHGARDAHGEGVRRGREKGYAEGLAEGEWEKALAIAWKMKEKGLPPEDIRDMTGLSIEEIGRLQG